MCVGWWLSSLPLLPIFPFRWADTIEKQTINIVARNISNGFLFKNRFFLDQTLKVLRKYFFVQFFFLPTITFTIHLLLNQLQNHFRLAILFTFSVCSMMCMKSHGNFKISIRPIILLIQLFSISLMTMWPFSTRFHWCKITELIWKEYSRKPVCSS